MKVRAILFESSGSYLRYWLRLVPPAITLSCLAALPGLLDGGWGALVSIALELPVVFVLQAIHVIDSAETRPGHPLAGLTNKFGPVRTGLKSLLAAYGLMALKLGLLTTPGLILYYGIFKGNPWERNGSLIVFGLLYLFLATRWSMIMPVILLEDVGARRAFRRSQQLVRGHTIRMFAVLLVANLVPWVMYALISAVAAAAHGGEQLHEFLRAASAPLADVFVVIVWTNAYFALRSEHDGAERSSGPSPYGQEVVLADD
jgi:hypothetical protein